MTKGSALGLLSLVLLLSACGVATHEQSSTGNAGLTDIINHELSDGDVPLDSVPLELLSAGRQIDEQQYIAAGDLDACNGMQVNGLYGDRVTDSQSRLPACFPGEPHGSFFTF